MAHFPMPLIGVWCRNDAGTQRVVAGPIDKTPAVIPMRPD